MDCLLRGSHAVKQFCSSIVCASKIGGQRDIYFEFDAIDGGLTIRALNDAKSAYCCFRYQPTFFEKCTTSSATTTTASTTTTTTTTSPNPNAARRKRTLTQTQASQFSQSQSQSQSRFSCRLSVKALVPIVKPRKDIVSLRVRSEYGSGNCRGAMDAADDDIAGSGSGGALFVSFEFILLNNHSHGDNNGEQDPYHRHPSASASSSADFVLRVVHRVKVADADAVSAVLRREDASELIASPKILLNLLDPLKRTVEAALIIRSNEDTISATSFHHHHHATAHATAAASSKTRRNDGDEENMDTTTNENQSTTAAASSLNNNAILQATSASLLKTVTFLPVSELVDHCFRDDREFNNAGTDDDDDVNVRSAGPAAQIPPKDVNEGVVLVFPIKECKAMLQYCHTLHQQSMHQMQQQPSTHYDLHEVIDPEKRGNVTLYYHWGGRPLLFETHTSTTSAELVLATLDHTLLSSASSSSTTIAPSSATAAEDAA